ncbi:C4-dicarboxylate permease [Piscirickettsia salmonis]|uniref:Sodium:dicarboxylate symporter n=1 Tax=Piscirickettsia salmonis TaxID=1238 RepID=A0A1L6TGA0_PISSA|nr:dicarboxylate/amino acid:cation symporter [Piscirickettsia salmonis]AKP72827.1 Na+:H+ dicarboxylate symporter [Piscirickettsia salmonis LF-89 = ATCC VR-1361]ALB21433.1 Sodium:dicarboxylate symporter [Piscirickettsia salmonis]ALY01664.1 Na+:H+ dicarboxylate symporter [Piscirickettsia salmonis]AMA41176.1 Na+:H+ dicarboxylate symporter [Piscirickettsia salmonis]AOS36365.1 Na+:H+ dicarboxylate symporter [Piscirickettsia salmonis]
MKPLLSILYSPIRVWRCLKAWQQVILALILGALFGFAFKSSAEFLKPLGDLFINGINMIVMPLVFIAIVSAITSVGDGNKMRRVGLRAIVVYAITMILAAMIGIGVAVLVQPGLGLAHAHSLQQAPELQHIQWQSFVSNLIPANPLRAFVDGNILQVIVFAALLGIALRQAGEKAAPVINFFQAFTHVVFRLAGLIISFAPYGVFALSAWVFSQFGLSVLWSLIKLIFVVYLACLLHMAIVYGGGLRLMGIKPLAFFKKIRYPLSIAYTTSSSAATLPVSIEVTATELKVPREIAQFLLPLGANFNLNGLSIYVSAATIFAANFYGVHLHIADYITLVLTIVLTAMGAAGVPGSGVIVMGAVMSSLGLPLGAIPLVVGVDRLNDMMQTMTNVAGDVFATTVVAKQEQERTSDFVNVNSPGVSN